MRTRGSYRRGLHELGDGLYAYLQPDGGWGWSNAGLITGDGASLLVDTLFDLRLTAEMLAEMAPMLARNPLSAAFNTHGNGDHCFGNQLLPAELPIHATRAAAAAMRMAPPAAVQKLVNDVSLGPEWVEFARQRFGSFEFGGIELREPTATFDRRTEVRVGNRVVELLEVGPAHSEGDAIAYVADAATVFSGDILFVGGTPIVWSGPIANWLAACERILALGARTVIPGHGPVSGPDGVHLVLGYLTYVHAQARMRFDAGLGADEAADDIELGDFADLGDAERIVVNVETAYREFDPARAPVPVPQLFARMAAWAARH